jgi:hypothetical protein
MAEQQQSNIAALEAQERNFILIDYAENPLKRVENKDILKNMIDPTTGNPYEGGIVLEGEFASLSVLNNNNRIYSEDNYLPFIEDLKKRVWSADGLYGEYEHPKNYSTDGKNVSHKILDVWYDKLQRKVFGIVLILNTTNGRNAMEVIKSGGRLGISARAGGKEIKNPNGTFTATIKMIVTFDLVWHPGFSSAKLGLVNLNESEREPIQRKSSFTIYETNLGELDNLYETYLLDKDRKTSFLEWVDMKQLFESFGPNIDGDTVMLFEASQFQEGEKDGQQNDNLDGAPVDSKQQKMQDKLQDGQTNDQQQVEQQLSDAVDQELTQQQQAFTQQMKQAQIGLGRKMKNISQQAGAAKAVGKFKKQGNSVFDGSAGFVSMGQGDDGYNPDKQVGRSDAQGTGFLTQDYDTNPYANKQINQDDDLLNDPYGLAPDHGLVETDANLGDARMFNGSGDHLKEAEKIQKMYERQFSGAQRQQLADRGQALPDGSFPIVNEKDLQNAISTYGLSSDKPRAKKWIIKRAKALGKGELIPKSWT